MINESRNEFKIDNSDMKLSRHMSRCKLIDIHIKKEILRFVNFYFTTLDSFFSNSFFIDLASIKLFLTAITNLESKFL